ncbi:MAG: asparagine synthetase B [Gemmatimonadota bacterium]|nr:asparagine synthetase B [Gemmatimonadota bacterium]MDE2873761.1 asparagine synthetase B [Gemmatimonadota bacterium]
MRCRAARRGRCPRGFAGALRWLLAATPAPAAVVAGVEEATAQQLLVPMDHTQADHLKAYGLTYRMLERGGRAEWLLNFRDGSFFIPDTEDARRQAALMGVTVEPVGVADEARVRGIIAQSNMESVILEKATSIAVYTPPNSTPWDDAVTMALEYAEIPYEKIWDIEVLRDGLDDFEWLHLHHEDFTGQYSKFYITYAGAPWLEEEVARNEEAARVLGYPNVPALKKAVSGAIRDYVAQGGFLFAMCAAPETLELALAAAEVDIAAAYSDGTPADPDAGDRVDWGLAMAFRDAQIQIAPSVNAFSDIDGHQVNTPWRKQLGAFTLFDFSAKFDPVPTMLTQSHESVLPDFYGLTTSFAVDRLKPGVVKLGVEGGWAKYIHGKFGEGTWTYYGGHDPEDPEHQIGDPPTDLALHPNSPGYRLILNNVLFPAARKKKLKT